MWRPTKRVPPMISRRTPSRMTASRRGGDGREAVGGRGGSARLGGVPGLEPRAVVVGGGGDVDALEVRAVLGDEAGDGAAEAAQAGGHDVPFPWGGGPAG